MRHLQGPPRASLTVRGARRRLVPVLLFIALAVLASDQLTKLWAVRTLTGGARTPLVGDLLGLTLVHNAGAAFSIASGMTWVFTVAAIAVSVVVLRVANRLRSRGWTAALGLLLGGALGNLADRLFRAPGPGRGEVVDFIAYGDLFVGNVADIAIVASACLMVLLGLANVGLDGRRGEPRQLSAASDGGGDGAVGVDGAGSGGDRG